jgi:hypothetical protein
MNLPTIEKAFTEAVAIIKCVGAEAKTQVAARVVVLKSLAREKLLEIMVKLAGK